MIIRSNNSELKESLRQIADEFNLEISKIEKNSLEYQAIATVKKISVITNKIDDETLKFNLFSIYGALLESKIIFPRNIDMRKLLDKLSLSRPILDYLIKARPQVISRMITEILKMNHSQLIVLLSETEKFINRFEVENKLLKKEKDKSMKLTL